MIGPSDPKKRVLITTPVLHMGGTEAQTLCLVKALAGAGYHVTICCYYEFEKEMVRRFEEAGAETLTLRLPRTSNGLTGKKVYRLVKELTGVFNTLCPDILHVQYLAPGLLTIVCARLARIPLVFATVHQPGSPYGRTEKGLIRVASMLCNAFFCVSLSVEKSWFGDCRLFDSKSLRLKRAHCTIYNALDVETISGVAGNADKQALRGSLGVAGKPVIGSVGRLRWEKGQETLIEAMATVIGTTPEAVLLVIGDGPDREMLRRKTENLGLNRNILFLGQKEPEEIYRLYGIMDIVVVPSVFEGFGIVAGEAMAAGLPVIASNVGGLREVVEDGVTGCLIRPGDPGELADALRILIGDEKRRLAMGMGGFERVSGLFSMDRYSSLMATAYRHFSNGSSKRAGSL